MSENCLFLSGEENEKPESTRRSGLPLKVNQVWSTSVSAFVSYPVDIQNDRTNERMTENDHITSAFFLTEVIIIIICYRPSDKVKIDRQGVFN